MYNPTYYRIPLALYKMSPVFRDPVDVFDRRLWKYLKMDIQDKCKHRRFFRQLKKLDELEYVIYEYPKIQLSNKGVLLIKEFQDIKRRITKRKLEPEPLVWPGEEDR